MSFLDVFLIVYSIMNIFKTNISVYKLSGGLLVFTGILGFVFVADDLRHTGELIGVGGILMAGIILFLSDLESFKNARLYLQWIAFGLLAGLILGAGLDNMLLGSFTGISVGIISALLIERIIKSKST